MAIKINILPLPSQNQYSLNIEDGKVSQYTIQKTNENHKIVNAAILMEVMFQMCRYVEIKNVKKQRVIFQKCCFHY